MNKFEMIQGPSCLTQAAEDEPLFVLRAHDELAPGLIREWVKRYYDTKMDTQGKLTMVQKDKKNDALAIAMNMEVWLLEQKEKAKKKLKPQANPGGQGK